MLKIRDDVDLKELEKFGFKKTEYSYIRNYNREDYTITIEVEFNRRIYIENDFYDNDYACLIPNVIYDLIQAGLVEKVEDK